jgi:hypothetical protein
VSTVTFAPEAADCFVEVLTILCRDTVAVTIRPQDGEPFGAVLVSNDGETLVYESWDDMVVEAATGNTFTIRQIPGVFSEKEWMTTLLLAICVGYLGVDRFLPGRYRLGHREAPYSRGMRNLGPHRHHQYSDA